MHKNLTITSLKNYSCQAHVKSSSNIREKWEHRREIGLDPLLFLNLDFTVWRSNPEGPSFQWGHHRLLCWWSSQVHPLCSQDGKTRSLCRACQDMRLCWTVTDQLTATDWTWWHGRGFWNNRMLNVAYIQCRL